MLKSIQKSVIAAVRSEKDLDRALASDCELIFDLNPDLLTLNEKVSQVHKNGKKLFIHLDLATGIGKDKSGIKFAKQVGVDGIISTRVNIIKMAREAELFTVQRFFVVDSQSVDTTVEGLKASKADMIEVMPGTVSKIITALKKRVDVPIIAGGLIDTENEVKDALSAGAMAISTGKEALWSIGEAKNE